MNIKNKFYFIGLLCCLLIGNNSYAQNDLKFYVGADVGYSKYNYGRTMNALKNDVTAFHGTYSSKSKVLNFSPIIGLKYCDNFGAELGYTLYKKVKPNISLPVGNVYGNVKVNNIYADLLGYLPVSNEFELIGAIGLGRPYVKGNISGDSVIAPVLRANGITSQKTKKIGVRLGLGAQYNFNENVAMRAMFRYQKVTKDNNVELLKNISSFNLGLTYTI